LFDIRNAITLATAATDQFAITHDHGAVERIFAAIQQFLVKE